MARRCRRYGARSAASPKTIDITYDIRAFAPDLVADAGDEALPPTHSQEKRWSQAILPRLAEWVRDRASPAAEGELARAGFVAQVHAEAERLCITYEPLVEETGIVEPEVIVEFGARSTGEPHAAHTVHCDAAAYLPDLVFPEARPVVMLAERTFWEKATAPFTSTASRGDAGASGSTMRRRSRATSSSFPPVLRNHCSPMTMQGWFSSACSSARVSRSTRSWSDAP